MQDGIFSAEPGNIDRWLTAAGILCSLVAIAVIVWGVARTRGRSITPTARWVFVAGVLVLPTMAMFVGTTRAYRGVKQTCFDCHTMKPWTDDMMDPKSDTQAAKHFRHRWINKDACYTCHSGYGLAGDVEAKISGMSHVWNEYVAGVPETIRIARPYPVATCLQCHLDTPKYKAADPHVDKELQPDILSGRLSCFECHTPPHPRKSR